MDIGAIVAANLKPVSDATMPELAVIMQATQTDDMAGGYTEVWEPLKDEDGEPILWPCRILPLDPSDTEYAQAERLTNRTPYLASFRLGTPLTAEDCFYNRDYLYQVHGLTDDYSYEVAVDAYVSREG